MKYFYSGIFSCKVCMFVEGKILNQRPIKKNSNEDYTIPDCYRLCFIAANLQAKDQATLGVPGIA